MKKLLTIPTFAALALAASACSDDTSPLAPDANQDVIANEEDASPSTSDLTIAEIVVDEATEGGADEITEFRYLLDAVLAADPAVLETLSGNGQFTVFAPTDVAFETTLTELGITLDDLAKDPAFLTEILLYHVSRGAEDSSEILAKNQIRMLNGEFARISMEDGEAKIDESTIIATDIRARNGIIHVIDRVLLPPTEPQQGNRDDDDPSTDEPTILELVETLVRDGAPFEILQEAVKAASPEIAETLNGNGQFTVFAPTDDAFAALLGDLGFTAAQLLSDRETLDAVLLYHVTRGRLDSSAVVSKRQIRMLDGNRVFVDGTTLNDDVEIIATDVEARNGIVHVIDTVLLPPSFR